MQVNAISYNSESHNRCAAKDSKNPLFKAVYTQPYSETLKVIRYNIDKIGMDKLSGMTHRLEWSKKWDMSIYGYMGKFHFEAYSKEKPKELVLDVLNINPLQKQPNEIDKEFEISAMTYNHTNDISRPFANMNSFKLVFKDRDSAKQAYDTLCRNYQVFDKTLWLKTRKSNFERICMAEENFNILEKAELLDLTKPYFEDFLQRMKFSKNEVNVLLQKIAEAYGQPNRGYHGIKHISDMIKSFDKFMAESNKSYLIKNPDEFRFAILMHDYINGEPNDVEKSAVMAREFLQKISPDYDTTYVEELIRATDYSKRQLFNFDQQLMQDIDVEVLGKSYNEYKKYSEEIRNQYSDYSDKEFNPERIKILKSFLDKNRIYNTEYYGNKYEFQARKNIEKEIANL